MDKNFRIIPAEPYPLGVSLYDKKIRVSAVFGRNESRGIVLSLRGETVKIEFGESEKHGRIYSCTLMIPEDIDVSTVSYRLFDGDKEFIDPQASGYTEHIRWMQDRAGVNLHGRILCGRYEITDGPHIPLDDSFFYMLSVRSFTAHASSGVRNRGTFEGLIEKKDYLKSLGVTGVVLMPCYDFLERMDDNGRQDSSMEYALRHYKERPGEKTVAKCNLWGYTGNAHYYMPKSSFSSSDDAGSSFANLTDMLHRDGIEIIMQFYFEPSKSVREILSILEFWAEVYRVDGFQLIGSGIPVREIEDDPILSDCKLLFDRSIVPEGSRCGAPTACFDDGFENDMRHFLKGDAYSIRNMITHLRAEPHSCMNVHYIARQEGMRLADIVTYNEKHNEHNGENNCDGRTDDFSWNCGVEGATRRTSVTKLRLRQMKNAISMVFLTQGIPLIYSGDEFGNTQYGNNNPYCQDNQEGYVKWNSSKQSRELLDWTRKTVLLRNRYRILHTDIPFRGTDYLSCAYPDISLHGTDAWRTQDVPGCHLVAVMYCMRYGCENDDGLIYIVYNMHWEPQKVSLPKPFKGQAWELFDSTADPSGDMLDKNGADAIIPSRSTAVFISISKESGDNEQSI